MPFAHFSEAAGWRARQPAAYSRPLSVRALFPLRARTTLLASLGHEASAWLRTRYFSIASGRVRALFSSGARYCRLHFQRR